MGGREGIVEGKSDVEAESLTGGGKDRHAHQCFYPPDLSPIFKRRDERGLTQVDLNSRLAQSCYPTFHDARKSYLNRCRTT